MTVVASLQGVGVRLGDTWAVDEVSLDVEEGELFVLVGPSGCGKSTLLRVMSGLLPPTRGAFLLDGADVSHVPPYERDVNQVFQSYALFPHMTVAENVAFGPRMRGASRAEQAARVEEALLLVSMTGKEGRRPAGLSGGEKQRVALARALACRPRLLLLDEPLSALDAALRLSVREELRALQRRLGTTFVLVTHDQDEALAMADRLAVLREGRVEQVGPAREVYSRPRTRFVARFLGGANVLERLGAAALGLDADGPIAVRREDVTLGAGPLEGEVLDVTYAGASSSVLVRARGVELWALGPGLAPPAQGETVRLSVTRATPLLG